METRTRRTARIITVAIIGRTTASRVVARPILSIPPYFECWLLGNEGTTLTLTLSQGEREQSASPPGRGRPAGRVRVVPYPRHPDSTSHSSEDNSYCRHEFGQDFGSRPGRRDFGHMMPRTGCQSCNSPRNIMTPANSAIRLARLLL